MSDTRTVVYVAATIEAAESGASALESAADGLAVEPATTVEEIGYAAEMTDCIVFAETPTTAEGAAILDVIDVAAGTPLILFCERSFDPAMAHSTDGVTAYVRSDTPEAVAHLADEVAWLCSPGTEAGASVDEGDRHRRAAAHLASSYGRLTRRVAELTAERDRFETAAGHLAGVADGLREERGRLRAERDRLSDECDQLREERDRFERTVSIVPDPVCAYTVESAGTATVRAVNDAFSATFGVDPDTARGEAVLDVVDAAGVEVDDERFRAALDPADADQNWVTGERPAAGPTVASEGGSGASDGTTSADAIAGGEGRESTLDGRYDGADGERATTVTVVPPATAGDGPGADTGLVACRDVTERRRAEEELAARSRRLESIAELVESDLQEPLNVARGYLEVAEETGDREHFAEVDDAHDALAETTAHLTRLVGRDAMVVERAAIDLHDLARRAWSDADTGDASLDLGPNARFEGNRDQLQAVFEDLLSVASGDESAAGESEKEGDAAAAPVVSVGATDDGFYVAGRSTGEEKSAAERTATVDGTDLRSGRVERVAAAHGWHVGVAESDEGTAVAFRGVDVERE
ncbi:phytochrome sensor protein [Halovivax asiaticus JCM 14624]|uniref:Phytochrome sensor protein n=1 Tax=Halovivax asiaticus JCM 14624 TaxID=1227490 RepID=M0BJM0_9EURY|nr:hypothetical protein [Halovivax asiaticus]ELZ11035.1 phytochrome sensor protein [Halovivax asiaticus JCM 14624]